MSMAMRNALVLLVFLVSEAGCGTEESTALQGDSGSSGSNSGGSAGEAGNAGGGTGGSAGSSGSSGFGGSSGFSGSAGSSGSGGSGGSGGAVDSGTVDGGFVPEPGLRSSVYPADWIPGFKTTRPEDGAELFIQDFSYAGYLNSEAPLPQGAFHQVYAVTADPTGVADATGQIQAAIDQAVANPAGGIVEIPPGLFRLKGPLAIRGSNVVLRGAGADQTKLWFVDGGGAAESTALLVTGSASLQESANAKWAITREGQIFEDFVEVQDPSGIAPGDDISIAWNITAEFKAEHNSTAYWYHVKEGTRRTFFRRTVAGVAGNRIYFHVPLRYPVKLRDTPVVLRAKNYASGNGVEKLAISTAMGSPTASWNSGVDQATAIRLQFCKDCWIRDVASFAANGHTHHLRSHGIAIGQSFRVTVANIHFEKAEHLGGAGNGYLFQLSRSNEVLLRDCTGKQGRHNFSINWDFGTSGNVFLRIKSAGGLVCGSLQAQLDGKCSLGPCDFHHALAIANLYDSPQIDDALNVGNRRDWSTGAGHTGTMNVFWRVTGAGRVYAYNQGMGYLIGTSPSMSASTDLSIPGLDLAQGTEPEDFSDFIGNEKSLAPSSLFEEQLARRLAK